MQVLETNREYVFPDLGSAEGYPPPGTLTSTAITGWMTCARCWAHDNIQHLTKSASTSFAVGTTVHHIAELVGTLFLQEDIGLPSPELQSDILERSMAVFDREVSKPCDRNGTERVPPTDEEAVAGKNTAYAVSQFAIPHLYRLFRERVLVTQEYVLPSFLNPFPFPMTGRCDAIYGGVKVGRPLMIGDFKTAGQRRRPDLNNRLQGGIYCLFVEQGGERPIVVFDTFTKTAQPKLDSYTLGLEGHPRMSDPELMTIRETVTDVAAAISDGYQAWLDQDWQAFRRCFPIGQGWNGRHDYDHGLPEAHLAA
jgi:hypothetical protein